MIDTRARSGARAWNGDEVLEGVEFGLEVRRELDGQGRLDQLAFAHRDTGRVERVDQFAPR